MLGINTASLFFADRPIFKEISFIINKQDRIGLVGKNGAGKSTLLKTLAGVQALDSGNISRPSDMTIGYLPQDMDFVRGRTVWDETASSFVKNRDIQTEIDEINDQLASREDYESEAYMKLLDNLSDLNEKLNLLGVDTIEAEIEKILLGLGFKRTDFVRQTDEFSGGWRMRIELAKILLQKADVLLLDEPTNHLDIESIQWLEDFLKSQPGAVMLISHDRAFLDNLTNRTIEISLAKIYDYNAPYTRYKELRSERKEQELAAYANQQKQIKDTEEFIERFRAKATKAVQVQSRIKQLDRMEKIEIEEEDTSSMRFSFPPAPHSGKVSLRIEDLSKSYDGKSIFSGVNFTIERGEKVSFVGKNGEGKSTLSRIINGEKQTNGAIELGYQVSLGYFAQNQAEVMNTNKTVFETIDEAARGEVRKKVRSLLGSFLFGEDEIDKKVKVLSGGERARLAMCKLLLEPSNLLILDEPTNHLDIRSKEILKDALQRFDGTLILISHDRDFLKDLTTKSYEFSMGKVREHIGGIEEFLRAKKVEDFRSWEAENLDLKSSAKPKEKKPKNSYLSNKELKQKIRAQKASVRKVEKEVEKLENAIEELNVKLKAPDSFKETNYRELIEEWEKHNELLEKAMHSWEKEQKRLDDLLSSGN